MTITAAYLLLLWLKRDQSRRFVSVHYWRSGTIYRTSATSLRLLNMFGGRRNCRLGLWAVTNGYAPSLAITDCVSHPATTVRCTLSLYSWEDCLSRSWCTTSSSRWYLSGALFHFTCPTYTQTRNTSYLNLSTTTLARNCLCLQQHCDETDPHLARTASAICFVALSTHARPQRREHYEILIILL
jgi:hypothetical protein